MKPQVHDSDSEDDGEYVPPVAEDDSSSSDDEPDLKRARTTSPKQDEQDESAKKAARDALWASFQASVSQSATAPSASAEPAKMVKIEKRFRYAGEEVLEVIEVSADSDDAKKWPLWKSSSNSTTGSHIEPSNTSSASDALLSEVQSVATPPPSSTMPPDPTPAQKPAPRRPGPRKPRTSLASLPAPVSKAKKLTTLEKSAMDWRSHVSAQDNTSLQEELEANKRSGGYLEKVEFLKRVEDRKEDLLEAAKSSKRRRG